jgi:branched-chain amino acid transport system permease protein
MLETIFTLLISSLFLSSLLYVISIGFYYTQGVSEIINFAHGATVIIGCYISLFSYAIFNSHILSLLIAMILTGVVSIIELLVVSFAVKRASTEALKRMNPLLLTLGLAFFIEGAITFFFRPDPVTITNPTKYMQVYGINVMQLTVIAVAFSVVLFSYILRKTLTGKAMYAVAENQMGAKLLGFNPMKIFATTWFISGCLCGLGGFEYINHTLITPFTAHALLFRAFTVVIVTGGSLRSIWTPFAGSLLVGTVQCLAYYFLGGGVVIDLVVFLVLLAFLIMRGVRGEA